MKSMHGMNNNIVALAVIHLGRPVYILSVINSSLSRSFYKSVLQQRFITEMCY